MALHVPVEETLEAEALRAQVTGEPPVGADNGLFVLFRLRGSGDCRRFGVGQRVFDAVAAIDEFQGGIAGKAELLTRLKVSSF